jgi:hypothetical protein
LQTEVIWEQVYGNGLEHLILRQDDHLQADGLALGMLEDSTYRIKYQVVCDMDWVVQRVRVEDLLNNQVLVLIKNADGSWTDEHTRPFEELKGCTDVDIRITPFTNTFPIKRLNLKLHESRVIAVVYFSIPHLTISRLDQRYTFLSQEQGYRVYKYESLVSGFNTEIKVDPDGLVMDYPGIFKMAWKRTG